MFLRNIIMNRINTFFHLGPSSLLKRCYHQEQARAVVIGCFKTLDEQLLLSETGDALQSTVESSILDLLTLSNFKADVGSLRTFYNLHPKYPSITVAGLGDDNVALNKNDGIDKRRENIRVGIGKSIKLIREQDFRNVLVDGCGIPSASAEGAYLSKYVFDKFKSSAKTDMQIDLLNFENKISEYGWEKGVVLAESQNFARELMETPSNYKFPLLFAETISERFSKYGEVETFMHNEEWARGKNMDCFLSVGQGSSNRNFILELNYRGAETKPIVLVGKGVTFDTGGISIKASKDMATMKGDMGGAACMLATMEAIVRMKVPVNLTVLVGLAENMPSGSATKPGDVFTAMNGKTVEVDDTDFEGRLLLADLLCYAGERNPEMIISAATLTYEVMAALGAAATGAYSTCDNLWSSLNEAGKNSGDRMWRMPLFDYYTDQMKCSMVADLRNNQKKPGMAGSCTAAAFLKEFVTVDQYAHLDIASVAFDGAVSYLDEGMSGRPTRTIIGTVMGLSNNGNFQDMDNIEFSNII